MTSLGIIVAAVLAAAQPGGQVAFVQDLTGKGPVVCIADVQFKSFTPIGPAPVAGAPVWSPDGRYLAVELSTAEGTAISLINVEEDTSTTITATHKWNRYPRWSPDGTCLAYSGGDGESPNDQRILIYDLSTQTEEVWGGPAANLMRPVWMPSMRLLYALRPGEHVDWGGDTDDVPQGVEWLEGEQGLLAIGWAKLPSGNAGTDLYVLTKQMALAFPESVLPSRGNYAEWAPEFSHRGDSVAFESNDGGDREIFVLTRRGAVDVTNHGAADWNPVWAPDGDWLAFESLRSGRRGVYRVFARTARLSEVAVSKDCDNWAPTWSPDSKWVAFVSTRTGIPKIFVTDLRQERVFALCDDAESHAQYAPAWRPRPKKGKH